MAQITGVKASSWHELTESWWQFVLVGFILISIALGTAFFSYLVFKNLHKRYLKRKSSAEDVNASTKSFIQQSSTHLVKYRIEKVRKKPGSYGVYLGGFESPPSELQIMLLAEWDLLIVDPSQNGVMDTMLSGLYQIPPQVLARMDVEAVVAGSSQKPVGSAIDWIKRLLEASNDLSRRRCVFTGIVISRWEDSFSASLLAEFVRFIDSLGLSVYLEASPPKFLLDPKLVELDGVAGLVLCNGTISDNGEERDAFQMAEMRPTIKAFVSQACLRNFVVLLCEVLDDKALPSNAVIKRSYQWSRFYSALPWIGTKSALFSAELSLNQKEPLAAFDWLKESRVMKAHEKWCSNQHISPEYSPGNSNFINELHSSIGIEPKKWHTILEEVTLVSAPRYSTEEAGLRTTNHSESSSLSDQSTCALSGSSTPSDTFENSDSRDVHNLNLLSLLDRKAGHPFSTSPNGSSYDYLGCFPLGFTASRRSFGNVVQSQERLRAMQLLDEIKPSQLAQIGQALTQFCNALGSRESGFMSDWLAAMQELSQQLCSVSATRISPIRVYIGLDSGFQIQPGKRFWAVYRMDEESLLNIYLSRNVHDVAGGILHTFLSSRGCPRHECFQAEITFSEWKGTLVKPSGLPPRILQDISLLSPAELLKFLQVLSLSPATGDLSLTQKVYDACENHLLDATDFMQMKKISTVGYLSGQVSARDLIANRVLFYKHSGCQHPKEKQALAIFMQINIWVGEVLRHRRIHQLQEVTHIMSESLLHHDIDARTDLVALSLFCAMRKHAFDEAYMEVSDRNPLFNDQSDQAAAFAELFATGARCEAYFDLTPSAFGKLLSERYRDHHHKTGHEPPLYSDSKPNTPSSYAAAKIDVDPNKSEKTKMSGAQRFTFLSVFAIPALLDILLLTTTGRGLYLSGFMSHREQHSATLALMISLLISGAVGTWITCGGSYYLISMAFSAMNMFVVTRLAGGLAFTLAVAAIGFAAVGAANGITAGIIFFLYLIALTSYLCLLASLANFSYPGSSFESGRPIIIMVIPFLFISPVLTIFIPNHDIDIYLSVLYTFIFLLVLGVRRTGLRWMTWYLKIKKVTDQDLRQWYIKTYEEGNERALVGLTDPAVLKLAREAMIEEISRTKKWFAKKTKDTLVLELARSYQATFFLLEWYSGYSGTPLPIPYSSTWNMQTKVALQTLQQLQKGIRLHNAFIHWRQAGDEVGCSLLYFIVALLDKWNTLLAGGQILGLAAMNTRYRMPVGFALAYYLIGAVLLDFNAAKLHTMTARGQNMLIGDVSSIPEAVKNEVRARRYLYWTMLGRYLLFHVWSLVVSSSLLWVFDSTKESTILFLAYIGAYTGLLWYQYTKIFTGPRSLKPLIAAVLIGIPLGQLLRHFFSNFMYCDVVALAVACWTAGILSLYHARIRTKPMTAPANSTGVVHAYNRILADGVYHAFSNPGKDPLLSQDELRILYDNLRALREEERYEVEPLKNPGLEIKAVLLHALKSYRISSAASSRIAFEAFPEAAELLEQTIHLFEAGSVVLDCIPMAVMTAEFTDIKAVGYFVNGHLRIIIGCEMMDVANQQSCISIFCRTTAEVLFHAVCETFMALSHDDATLAEHLLAPLTSQLMRQPSISQSVQNLLLLSKPSSAKARELARFCEDKSLQHFALGLHPDTDWEWMPRDIRELVIRRCTGQEERMLTESQREWLILNKAGGTSIKTFLSRCNFGAFVAMSSRRYALGARDNAQDDNVYDERTLDSLPFLRAKPPATRFSGRLLLRSLKAPFGIVYHTIGFCLKLLAVACVADSEFQREINYAVRSSPRLIQMITILLMTGIWEYAKFLQSLLMPLFLLHGRKDVKTLWDRIDGTTVSLKRHKIVIENIEGLSTAFVHTADVQAGTFELHQYSGNHDKEPTDTSKLQRISTYSKSMLLLQRDDYNYGTKENVYKYEYHTESGGPRHNRLSKFHNPRFPMSRRCIDGSNKFEELHYNYRGLVQNGSYILHGSLIRFNCHYRQGSNSEDELLRAEFVLPHLSCTVSWAAPPVNHQDRLDESRWIPHPQVTEATFVLGADIYESRWSYDHKFDPTIHTTLNGETVETPPIIQWDHLGVLKKPAKFSFLNDDSLISFKSLRSRAALRWLGLNTHRNQVSTSKTRSRLWKAWRDTPGFDGVLVRWLDERLLRRDPVLRSYWRRRDRGYLKSAEAFLDDNADGIMASADLDNSISGWAPLAIKIADLYSFGQGGDANSRLRSKEPDFDNDGLQVLAVDSGTWPNEGGGVSACRRDMINNLGSVNWHMIAESANDFGLPKHQTEMNVRSLKIIPLWGLDFLTPTHGLFKDKLDTTVEHVPRHATKVDVERNFLPILTALVKGARSSRITNCDILQTTRALVNLNTYFSDSKHWKAVWTCRTVKDAWRNLWVSQDLVTPTPSEGWFQTEFPTVAQLDTALELWFRYLFIFSIPVPEKIPAIFQASHHSVSASYGIVCKVKRGCTLQIWDHAISWRETNLYLSSELCSMAPFIRNALLGLMRITSQLILHHADTILPCADFFNPGWEVEIGTIQGQLEHRNTFKRKIDPVVNGIPDMSKFAPISQIKSTVPTVTMLSHVWYAKDIKTAILAADIIVNEWGFKDYKLDIYGAVDKAPSYSTDCFEIIASKSLPCYVTMCGEANPTTVLEKTWVFLNSSISEGLPLALGEAALTGAPVVCTDVGASLRVLTDPDTGDCFSSVVAPNDARNLARAQINFLALLDEWAPYANDPDGMKAPALSDKPTPEDIAIITRRMYDKTEERRALGMRSRDIVQKSFGGARYLREHEQMLWIGKSRYELLHKPPIPAKPAPRIVIESLPVPSQVWGATSIPSAPGRRIPTSSVQASSMMTSSIRASTLMSPGIRHLFDSRASGEYRGSGSKSSTLLVQSVENHTPIKKAIGPRVSVLPRNGTYQSSTRSTLASKPLPGEDTFVHDITIALEQV